MSTTGIVGFWSFSHDDNQRDGNGLLRLASHIQDEFALVTGETLSLFIDRDDISWGDEWRRRIGTALAETTFFIPIITPLYFKRQECRRELLSFVGQAKSLNAMELVMPIYYVDVPDLIEDNVDEARALVAKTQYADWRELRLAAEDSPEYRRGVHSLAIRLAEISSRYEQAESEQIVIDAENSEEDGLMDLIGILEQKIPEWERLLDNASVIDEQIVTISNSFEDRIKRAERTRKAGPLLIVLRDYAQNIQPLLQGMIERTKEVVAASIDLDPVILKLLRSVENYPEASPSVLHVLAPIEDEAREFDITKKERERLNYRKLFEKYKGMSKDMARILRMADVYLRYEEDIASLVAKWHRDIKNIERA